MDPRFKSLEALRGALPEGPAAPEPVAVPELPDPMKSAWVARLRQEGVAIPAGPTMGQLVQRSAARVRELEAEGKGRAAKELAALQARFQAERTDKAWALVKARFDALALPERAYRALKQNGSDPVKVWEKVQGARGEKLRGAGADRLRELLSNRG